MEYDYFELRPCKKIGNRVYVLTDAHAGVQFWRIYGRTHAGLAFHIQDFDDKKDGMVALRMLQKDPDSLTRIESVGFKHTTFTVLYHRDTRDAHIHMSESNKEIIIKFKDDDEWSTIKDAQGNIYDVHFLNDEDGISICLYIVIGGWADTSTEGQANSNVVLI